MARMIASTILCLAVATSAWGLQAHAPRLRLAARGAKCHCQQRLRLCAEEEEAGALEGDWREMRAKLVAQESGAAANEGGYVYESPLIEQGSVILGGTQQEFGFALRQQYFHKSVMLLLQHDDGFTKGIILNRPSAYELDGWRVWFGGDVAEGAMFRGASEAKGEREIICLHALEGDSAARLSMPIIKGVAYTTLEGAKALVAGGEAEQKDFWVFVGYAGWAPSQLQGEVERDSWFLASADSGTLLQELLTQGTELPPPSEGIVPGNGLATWEKLMISIGKNEEVERTRGSLSDRMLSEWCTVRLIPPSFSARSASADAAASADAENLRSASEAVVEAVDVTGRAPSALPNVRVGTVLRSGAPANRVVLTDQFLHKALFVVVHELPDGGYVGAVLNRPTANLVQFHSDGKPRRCISFGGDGRLRGAGLDIDSNGLMWLAQASKLQGATTASDEGGLGSAMGDSGLRRVPAVQAAESIKAGETELNDFLLVSGLVCFASDEMRTMLDQSELHIVPDPTALWPQVFALADAVNVAGEVYGEGGAALSDGTGVWWAAAQLDKRQEDGSSAGDGSSSAEGGGIDALLAGLQAMPPAHIADEALAEWLKFFAGHKVPGEES